MQNKSFTLIELLVVIVIVGILAGVIIVSVSSSINKANFAKAQSFSNTVQNELLGDLVSEWTFNSPAVSGKTEDSWGNNDGTLYGANGLPQLQTKENCVYGTCYLFDGVDDYINYGSISPLIQSFTITLWVERNGSTGSNGGIVGIDMDFWVEHGGLQIFDWNDGRLVGRVRNGLSNSENFATFETTFQDKKWKFYSFIFTKPYIIAYTDGGKKSETFWNYDIGWTSYNVSVGRSFTSSYFKGSIDDVRIYDAALSTSQIKQQYVAGLDSLLANGSIAKEEYNERINSLALYHD